eukprot:6804486-Prymnesium_polylepis.1
MSVATTVRAPPPASSGAHAAPTAEREAIRSRVSSYAVRYSTVPGTLINSVADVPFHSAATPSWRTIRENVLDSDASSPEAACWRTFSTSSGEVSTDVSTAPTDALIACSASREPDGEEVGAFSDIYPDCTSRTFP